MDRKKRNLIWIAAALVLLAAAGFLGGGAVVARRFRAPLPAAATLAPATVPRPGEAARAEAVFALPWGNAVTAAAVEPGDGSVVSGEPRISSRWRWGYRIWKVAATLRPLGTAGAAPGKFVLTLEEPLTGTDRNFTLAIPAVQVAEQSAAALAEKPRLADPETLRRQPVLWWLLIVAAAVVLLLAAGWFIRRKARNTPPPPPPWEVALSALAELEAAMKSPAFRPERGVWRLSDILRGYLASRFELPAVTAADCGFLADRAVAELDREDREFLRNFFAAAELVKFARVPADPAELERSVAAARRIVGRTVPPPEPPQPNAEVKS